jgi:hypothetical protein
MTDGDIVALLDRLRNEPQGVTRTFVGCDSNLAPAGQRAAPAVDLAPLDDQREVGTRNNMVPSYVGRYRKPAGEAET